MTEIVSKLPFFHRKVHEIAAIQIHAVENINVSGCKAPVPPIRGHLCRLCLILEESEQIDSPVRI